MGPCQVAVEEIQKRHNRCNQSGNRPISQRINHPTTQVVVAGSGSAAVVVVVMVGLRVLTKLEERGDERNGL